MNTAHDIYIVAAKRSPIGRFGGGLKELAATEIAAQVVRAAIPPGMRDTCEQVVAGQVLQGAVGMNPARQVALQTDIACEVPAHTVNMVCGSGLKAVADIADAIVLGRISCGMALGMESMSQAPHYAMALRWGRKFGNIEMLDALFQDGLRDPLLNIGMGETAENIAAETGITRQQQDAYAALSQQRAAAAKAAYAREIVAIECAHGVLAEDEHPRPDTTEAKLAGLKPGFRRDGSVTAGNASGMNDGAAAVFLADQRSVEEHGWKPLARVVDWAARGCEPRTMGLGPVGAIRHLCRRTGWSLESVDQIEINEAFAVQLLACIQQLELPVDKVNPRGGAIALGHPIGCSGARVLVSLVHGLEDSGGKRGIASLCIGGGMGIAMAVEMAV